jgi:hypothetical protein
MNDPNTLEQRLAATFGGLDTRPNFDARLHARLNLEASRDVVELATRARRAEQERYAAARRELMSRQYWQKWVSGLVRRQYLGMSPLEIVAGGTLLIGSLASVVSSMVSQQDLHQYAPIAVTVIGILLALAPIIPTAVLRRR